MEMDKTSTPKLNIFYWNSQSLYMKLIETFDFLALNDIDIALFSETWFQHKHIFSHPMYKVYRVDRYNQKHGGVAIAVKHNIKHQQLPSLNLKIIESVAITVFTTQHKIHFVSVYYPGTRATATDLINFKQDMLTMTNLNNNYFICGDLNSRHRLWNCNRANSTGNILYGIMTDRNFIIHHPQTPTNYPPQSRSSPSTIDLIISNGLLDISQPITHNKLTSDHRPVTFSVFSSISKNKITDTSYDFKNANWSKYKIEINNKILLKNISLKTSDEIDNKITEFEEIISVAKTLSVPILQKRRNNEILLSPEIKAIIAQRNALRRKWQRSRNNLLLNDLKDLNFIIRNKIFQLKNDQWNNRLKSLTPASKNFWKVTKMVKNKHRLLPPLKKHDSFLYTDQEKAEEISDVFEKVHRQTLNMSDDVTKSQIQKSILHINNRPAHLNQICIERTSPKEIKTIIKKLKNNKSPGIDNLPNILLKHLPKKAHVLLFHIYNSCMLLQYFPRYWKHAKVVVIPKLNKDHSNPNNYRPISLLTSLSKILEKILLIRLNSHIDTNNTIPNFQFGLKARHSSNHQVARVTRHIQQNVKNKKSTGMVTLDVEKAFDCVWHDGLLHKMLKQNFPIYLIKIIQSFLLNRSFHVYINESKSTTKLIAAGVPQGSCLSPTLYNLFTADVPILQNCYFAMFADDTALLSTSTYPQDIVLNLCLAFESLSNYFHRWKIKVNTSKTQTAFFTNRRKQEFLPQNPLYLDGVEIPWKNNIKYLGVILDKKLKYKDHIDYTILKCQKLIKILYPLINRKSKLNLKNKLLLYKSCFRPILSFGCPIWANCALSHLRKIQVMQNKMLKLILNVPYFFSTTKLHQITDIEYVQTYINKLSYKFYEMSAFSENPLVVELNN